MYRAQVKPPRAGGGGVSVPGEHQYLAPEMVDCGMV